jgi:hypothetical protein
MYLKSGCGFVPNFPGYCGVHSMHSFLSEDSTFHKVDLAYMDKLWMYTVGFFP